MSTTELIVIALAVWRYSYMLIHEDGPLDIFDRLRRLANRVDAISALFACIYCMSIWIAAALLLLRAVSLTVFEIIVYIGALSAIAIAVQHTIERLKHE